MITCSDCGRAVPVWDCGTPKYGRTEDEPLCYSCWDSWRKFSIVDETEAE